ncbi:13563_t:CDS:2, partial [Entrophospora sp. SA101]
SELDHYNTVVMNESHERSLQTNVLIGLLRQGESDEALKLLDSEGSESVSNSVKQDLGLGFNLSIIIHELRQITSWKVSEKREALTFSLTTI